ncbi:hypothetical protein KIN20_001115 [Parelaphostrongylus tenuis]|uniref:Uncharacterized protein n=1 Tax=Parelaphostrongylus tenuis TaxID=148309 RepID=A0AAD5LTM0_PARTN|nr:hypothetical protein KIN20_001115 [Parelaphostrongylus tenuis]
MASSAKGCHTYRRFNQTSHGPSSTVRWSVKVHNLRLRREAPFLRVTLRQAAACATGKALSTKSGHGDLNRAGCVSLHSHA